MEKKRTLDKARVGFSLSHEPASPMSNQVRSSGHDPEDAKKESNDFTFVQSQNNVLELLVKKNPHNHFVLFVDPDTRLFYRYYLDGKTFIKVETLENS
jgi:hypothetical protein